MNTREGYARQKLQAAVALMREAGAGQRHNALTKAIGIVANYVADGALPRSVVEAELLGAATAAGMDGKRLHEVTRTISDILAKGKAPDAYYPDSIRYGGALRAVRATARWRGKVVHFKGRNSSPVQQMEAVPARELLRATTRITMFWNTLATQGEPNIEGWNSIAETVAKPEDMPEGGKDAMTLWSWAEFEDDNRGKWKNEDGTERLCAIHSVHALVLDYDDDESFSMEQVHAWWGAVRYVAHTSVSHNVEKVTASGKVKPAGPRGRVILALTRAVTEEEYNVLAEWVLQCGRGFPGITELRNARRLFFMPYTGPGGYEHRANLVDLAVDVDAILDPDESVLDDDDGPDITELARLAHTDLGNAQRFYFRAGEDVRWCEPRASWLVWSGKHWEWDERRLVHRLAQETVERIADEAFVHEAALKAVVGDDDEAIKKRSALERRIKATRKHHVDSQASRRISAVMNEARALPDVAVSLEDLDRHTMLLSTQSGTLDLESGRLRESRREDLITRSVAVPYDPAATYHRWDTFLQQILPDEDLRTFVQRAFGYALTGDNSEQRWFLFTGEGSNGKSTMLDTVRWIFGPYATKLPAKVLEVRQFEQHPTELMSLVGARLAVGSEPRKGAKWDAERIKSLTGDATITARRMRENDVEFVCSAKLIVGANDLPRTDDHGHGFYRRMVMVPFNVVISGEDIDPKLPEKLKGEAAGILNWMLAGLRDWLRGGLRVPEACLVEIDKYRHDQDPVRRFVEERCEVDKVDMFGSCSVSTDELYQAYRKWFVGEGLLDAPVSKVAFGKALTRLGFLSFEGHRKQARRKGIKLASVWNAEMDNPHTEAC